MRSPRALCIALALWSLAFSARAGDAEPAVSPAATAPPPKPTAPPRHEDLELLRDLELLQDLELLRSWDPQEDLPIPAGERKP